MRAAMIVGAALGWAAPTVFSQCDPRETAKPHASDGSAGDRFGAFLAGVRPALA